MEFGSPEDYCDGDKDGKESEEGNVFGKDLVGPDAGDGKSVKDENKTETEAVT